MVRIGVTCDIFVNRSAMTMRWTFLLSVFGMGSVYFDGHILQMLFRREHIYKPRGTFVHDAFLFTSYAVTYGVLCIDNHLRRVERPTKV